MIIIDLEIVLREFLNLVNLTSTKVIFIYKLTEIVIINKNKDAIFAILLLLLIYIAIVVRIDADIQE